MRNTSENNTSGKTDWRDWFCHVIEVAYGISVSQEDMTEEEYTEAERDGTESVMGCCFSENLTDADIKKFMGWVEEIANR